MNLSKPLLASSKLLYRIGLKSRRLLPKQLCNTFGKSDSIEWHQIERIYVINLDSQPGRWKEMNQELNRILDSSRTELSKLTVRYPAVDARRFAQPLLEDDEVNPLYTLGDQLFVEPQPSALPDRFELERPIRMSRPEIAVARSHIGVWRRVAEGRNHYVLVVEDDVWFERAFAQHLDQAWSEMGAEDGSTHRFDILYLSYKEVRYGAQKTFLSSSVFRPTRGLWYLSGYVLSRGGARKLLRLVPCRGPIDLWLNHQFGVLDVRATRKSIISQRRDGDSTNSYSILPTLTKIGVLDSEGVSLFQIRPQEKPIFAFGVADSGLSSLAMALSMLGYTCCSDLEDLPKMEFERLLEGKANRIFNAYVNIGSLAVKARVLKKKYPHAKFIITTNQAELSEVSAFDIVDGIDRIEVAILPSDSTNKWQIVCEHLRCTPPICSFPQLSDIGQRPLQNAAEERSQVVDKTYLRHDKSPWVVESSQEWRGIRFVPEVRNTMSTGAHVSFNDSLETIDTKRWLLRDDTFTGNLALFRPSNVEVISEIGARLTVQQEFLGVREYSAASISSQDRFLYGRFEATLQATNVAGVVTGFFLHRDSPRQEIDIEIVGNRRDRLLVNVFYNPGNDGARFDYGYRGTPAIIDLGFDATASAHRFAIEWEPYEIRWLVDEQLVHQRVNWDPTPVPQLPMCLHVNTWPSRSRELAGRLARRRLPATTIVKSIAVETRLAGI